MSLLNDLTAITTPALTDLVYCVQNSTDYKVTNAQLIALSKTNIIIPLTQAAYDALPAADKNNGALYVITDAVITAADIEYSSGVSVADKIDDIDDVLSPIGTITSATWTANTTSAANTRLTNSITLDKGVYLITLMMPVASASTAVSLRNEGWSANILFSSLNSMGAFTFPYEAPYDDMHLYFDAQQSATVNYSYLERGGLYAVKIK